MIFTLTPLAEFRRPPPTGSPSVADIPPTPRRVSLSSPPYVPRRGTTPHARSARGGFGLTPTPLKWARSFLPARAHTRPFLLGCMIGYFGLWMLVGMIAEIVRELS